MQCSAIEVRRIGVSIAPQPRSPCSYVYELSPSTKEVDTKLLEPRQFTTATARKRVKLCLQHRRVHTVC
jgi:hypothetical protein